MLGGNSFITIWNRSGNRFVRHEIHTKCRFTQRASTFATGSGENMYANVMSTLICRIPHLEAYRSPEEWQGLTDDEKKTYFTVQTDDILAVGIHRYEIGKEPGMITAPELRKKLQSNVMEVKAVRYSLHTALGKHIRAEGV